MKSNFSDIGTEYAVLLVLRPDIGLWYVSLNSINVAALSCLETKKIENYLLDCLQIFWTYQLKSIITLNTIVNQPYLESLKYYRTALSED